MKASALNRTRNSLSIAVSTVGHRDEKGNDIGGATYDSRVVGTRTIETRRRLDARDRLFSIVPDLRSVVRALSLSGRVPKFTAE
jgi:hypothetical protein